MDRAARRARGGQRCASSPGMQTTVPFPMVLRYSRGVLATAAAAAPAVAVALSCKQPSFSHSPATQS